MVQVRKGAGTCASLIHTFEFTRFLLLSVLLFGWIVPVSAQTSQSVSVNVTLNQDNLQPGQDLVVGIDVQNPDTPVTVDVFFGVLFPDGKTVCFVTQASLPSCELTTIDADPATFPPLLKNQEIPAGFSISVANAFQFALPVGAPSGQYLQFVGVSPAGALDDGQVDLSSDFIELKSQPFSVAGTSPATGTPSNVGTTALTDPSDTRTTNDPRLDLGALPFNPPIATLPTQVQPLENPPR
jgi:hypothetical protein